jgi:hypothetical protein
MDNSFTKMDETVEIAANRGDSSVLRVYGELEKAFKYLEKSRYSCDKINKEASIDNEIPGSLTWINLRKQYWRIMRSKRYLRSFTTSYREVNPITDVSPYSQTEAVLRPVNVEFDDYNPSDSDMYAYLLGQASLGQPSASNASTHTNLQSFQNFTAKIPIPPQHKPFVPMNKSTGISSNSIFGNSFNSSSNIGKQQGTMAHPSFQYFPQSKSSSSMTSNQPLTAAQRAFLIEEQGYQRRKQLELEKIRQERERIQMQELAKLRQEQEEKRRREEQSRREAEEREVKSYQLLTRKYNYISPETKFPSWLHRIRVYWKDVRRRNNPLVFDKHDVGETGSDLGSEVLIPVQDTIDEEYSDVDAALTSNIDGPSYEYGENLMMEGFIAVAQMLEQTCDHVYMSVTGCDRYDRKSWLTSTGSPCFVYENNPLPGWRKDIVVRMNGKTRGTTEVIYVAPGTGKRLRGRNTLHSYLLSEGISTACLSKFEYHGVFCVCHSKDDKSPTYIECSLGLAGCRQWLHSQCIGLGHLREDQIRKMESVICPFCAAYLDGTNEHEEFSHGKKLLRKITLAQPSAIVEVNGLNIEESSQPHKLWGSNLQEKYRYPDDAYKQLVVDRVQVPKQQLPPQPAESAAGSVVDAQDADAQPLLSTFMSYLDSSSNQVNDDAEIIIDPQSTSRSNTGLKTSSLHVGILQHRLFQELSSPSADDGEIMDEEEYSADDNSFGLGMSNIDSGPPVTDFDDNILPCDRQRYAKEIDGPLITIRVEGASTKLPLGHKSAAASDQQHALIDKLRLEILAKSAEYDYSLLIGHRYARDIIQMNMTRVNPVRRQPNDQGFALLPLDDGGLRMTTLNPPSATELYSCRSMHQACINHELCGFCLQTISSNEMKPKPSGQSPGTTRRKKRALSQKKRPGKKKLPSALIREKIELLDGASDSDEDDGKSDDELDAMIISSAFEGIVECNFGIARYPIHHHCIRGFDLLREKLKSRSSCMTIHDKPYPYDAVDDAQCDLCGRRGGVMVYFQIHPDHTSLQAPSADGWLAHAPCIYWIDQSKLLQAVEAGALKQHAWSMLPDKATATATAAVKTMFDLSFRIAACSLCGLYEGITYRCGALGCTIRAHALCMTQARAMNWTMTCLSGSEAMICLCPNHSKTTPAASI